MVTKYPDMPDKIMAISTDVMDTETDSDPPVMLLPVSEGFIHWLRISEQYVKRLSSRRRVFLDFRELFYYEYEVFNHNWFREMRPDNWAPLFRPDSRQVTWEVIPQAILEWEPFKIAWHDLTLGMLNPQTEQEPEEEAFVALETVSANFSMRGLTFEGYLKHYDPEVRVETREIPYRVFYDVYSGRYPHSIIVDGCSALAPEDPRVLMGEDE